MSDEAVNPEDGLEEEEASGGGKKIVFLIGAVVILLIAGVAAFFLFSPAEEVAVDSDSVEEVRQAEPVVFFPMPEITVNLESVAGRQQYLKLKATLELRNEEEIAAIEPFMPRILDAFQVYLRELRTTDLEGSAGMFRLKEELQRRVNTAVYPVEVRKILFEEILIQ